MGWQQELTITVRVLANDLGTPQRYSDTYLQTAIVAAATLVNQDITLGASYAFSVSGVTISPDPIDINDQIFQALVPLKTACILNIGDFQKSLGQGIRVRDGDSAIDTSVSFRGYRDILEFGPCATYESLKKHIMMNSPLIGAGANGGAVMSPYRGPDDNAISDVQLLYDNFARSLSSCRRPC